MSYAIVNIGSNIGDRRLMLSRAMRAIGMEFGDFEMSHVVETDPQGFESDHKFLNVAMMFQTELPPEEILGKIQEIERSLDPSPHRNRDGSYRDRAIDIDLIAVDDVVSQSETLTLPHPRMAERYFVLKPMEEIAPGWRHPQTGLTAGEMLAALPEK